MTNIIKRLSITTITLFILGYTLHIATPLIVTRILGLTYESYSWEGLSYCVYKGLKGGDDSWNLEVDEVKAPGVWQWLIFHENVLGKGLKLELKESEGNGAWGLWLPNTQVEDVSIYYGRNVLTADKVIWEQDRIAVFQGKLNEGKIEFDLKFFEDEIGLIVEALEIDTPWVKSLGDMSFQLNLGELTNNGLDGHAVVQLGIEGYEDGEVNFSLSGKGQGDKTGNVEINGEIDIRLGDSWSTGIILKANDTKLVSEEKISINADLELAVTKQFYEEPEISGNVYLKNSSITLGLEALKSRAGQSVGAPPYFSFDNKFFGGWTLDMEVQGEDFLKLNMPLVLAYGSADTHLSGTLRHPVSIGEVRLDRGEVSFPFGTFDIDEGVVTMSASSPKTPQINVHARGQSYEYDLELEVKGAISNPDIIFKSSPSMSTAEIMLLLTTGSTADGGGVQNTNDRLRGLGLYVGKTLLKGLGIGDELDNLRLRIGEKITEEGKETVNAEYELDDNWALLGEYDQFDDYNIDVKRKLFSF